MSSFASRLLSNGQIVFECILCNVWLNKQKISAVLIHLVTYNNIYKIQQLVNSNIFGNVVSYVIPSSYFIIKVSTNNTNLICLKPKFEVFVVIMVIATLCICYDDA